MVSEENILEVIFDAIEEINMLLPKEQRLKKEIDTILSGSSQGLDSLGLINLIVAIEQRFEDKFTISITLADERAMKLKDNPFANVKALSGYIAAILKEVQV